MSGDDTKRLNRIEKQLNMIAKEQAVSSVLLRDYNDLLKEHMKRTRQIEDAFLEHRSTHTARLSTVKDASIIVGLAVALARLFGWL